jgi:polysaccharide export outer membrane protein
VRAARWEGPTHEGLRRALTGRHQADASGRPRSGRVRESLPDGCSGTISAIGSGAILTGMHHPNRRVLRALGALAAIVIGAAAIPAGAVSGDYHIRPGDELAVSVYGEPNLTQAAVTVLPGGGIVIPLAGQVHVGGLTPTEAGDAVTHALARYVKHPSVTVAVAKEGPVEVLVLGNVKTPGKYELQAESRLTDALAAAGGLGPTDGNYPVARIAVGDGKVEERSLQGLLHDGDVSLNVPMQNEMTVYVPSPLVFNVQVIGAVDHPGDVAIHPGDRLTMAIARAGAGPQANADLNHVTVRHTAPDGKVQTTSVNLYEVLRNGDLSKDVTLQKGDLVYVPQGVGRRDNVSPFANLLIGLRGLIGI